MKKKILILVVALMLFMAVPMSASATAMDVRSTVVDTSVQGNATQFAYANNIVRLSNGTIVAGFIDSDSDVAFRFSTDGGLTWSVKIMVDDAADENKSHLCMAVNVSSDYVHFVYAKNNTTVMNIFHSYVSPITWLASSALQVWACAQEQDQPYIAFVDDAPLSGYFVVWRQWVAGTSVIYFSQMTGDTGSWAEKEPVDALTPSHQAWPCLAQNLTGGLHLSFSQWNLTDTTWDLMYSYVTIGAWETPAELNASHENQTEAKVVSSQDVGSDFMFYAWNQDNGTNTNIHVSLVNCDSLDDAGNDTLAEDGINVSCTINGTVINAVWINTSTATADEIYHKAINSSLVVISSGRVTDDDYVYKWPSCFWYNGTTNVNLLLVTRGTSTDVVYFDLGIAATVADEYAWIDDLIQLVIAVMGVVLVIIILKGLMMSFRKVGS